MLGEVDPSTEGRGLLSIAAVYSHGYQAKSSSRARGSLRDAREDGETVARDMH